MSSGRLTCGWLLHSLLVFLKLSVAPAGPVQPLNGSECTAGGSASYLLVFTGQWSPQAFPKQYPLFRPPAQWSKLMGKNHGCGLIAENPSARGEYHPFFFFCSVVQLLNCPTHIYTPIRDVRVGPSGLSAAFLTFPDINFFLFFPPSPLGAFTACTEERVCG